MTRGLFSLLFGLVLSLYASGAQFLNDTFTDADGTALESHAGEVGAAWVQWASAGGAGQIISNRLVGSGAGVSIWRSSAVPASADYSVSGVLHYKSGSATIFAAPLGRCDHQCLNAYWAGYTNGKWQLLKRIGGANLQFIGSGVAGGFAETLVAGTDYTVTLDMVGSTIRLLVNGVQRCSETDTAITTAGAPGVYLQAAGTSTTGSHIDRIYADDAGTAPSYGTTHAFGVVGDSLSGDYTLPGTQTVTHFLGGATRWNTDRTWNYSVPNKRADEVLSAQVPSLVARYPLTAGFGRRVAVVECGINDIGQGANAATTLSRITSIHTQLRTAGFATVAITLTKASSISGGNETIRQSVNTSIRAGATGADHIADLDAHPAFSNTADATYFTDGVHYTTAARAIGANIIAAAVPAPVSSSTRSLLPGIPSLPSLGAIKSPSRRVATLLRSGSRSHFFDTL